MPRMTSAVAVAVLTALSPSVVSAHAVLQNTKATQNSVYKGVVAIDHGCNGSPTRSIQITIPEGFIAAKPMPKAGWTLSIDNGPYAKAYPFKGTTLAQGAKSLKWTGDLPAEDYDEFVFQGFVTDAVAAGSTLYFPVVQECAQGAYHWTETPKPDDMASNLAHPAPGVSIAGSARIASNAVSIIDHLRVSETWARATSIEATAAQAYFTVENRGSEPDRLMGATSDIATSVAIVDARASSDTEQEAPVTSGLTIAHGERLELRPGAYHLSFSGLKRPLNVGETFQVTLSFEKAGPLTLTFVVEDSHAVSTGAVMPTEDAPDRM